MKRDTLRRFLSGLLLASLPGCCNTVNDEYSLHPVDAALFQLLDGGTTLPPEVCKNICNRPDCHATNVLDGGVVPLSCVLRKGGTFCGPALPGGRPPAGLRPAHVACADPVGAWFAYMAHVEAAAVMGFLQLAGELRALGAPAGLVAQALSAAEDERRHARMARRLALRFGATVPPVEIDATPPRSRVEIAADNAAEGGVLETFGVLISGWQARRSNDRRVRAAFARISEDELRHAELAEAVGRWLLPQLGCDERSQVAEARRRAHEKLAALVDAPVPARLLEIAGLPPPEVARTWAAALAGRDRSPQA